MDTREHGFTKVRDLLDSYHFNILKDMVYLLQVHPASNTKSGHVQALERVLFKPETVKKALLLLGKREKEALATIQRSGGKVAAGRLRNQLVHADP